MTPLQTVLAKLPGASRSGGGWKARCPSHEDSTPSLSLSEGTDGRVLLKCHAGCDTALILAAIGMTTADLFPKYGVGNCATTARSRSSSPSFATADQAVAALERRHGEKSAAWEYQDAEGRQVGVVVRWDLADGKKDFRPVNRRDGRWHLGAMTTPRPLYRLPGLAAADVVVVCEGEKAADAARDIGLVATTSAGGSQAGAQTDWGPLAGKTALILPDNDEAGEKYAEEVAGVLAALPTPASIKIIRLPHLPRKGDIVDWIDAHGGTAEPESMCAEIAAIATLCEPWRRGMQVWREIISFDALELPSFPTHALPDVLRRWVEAISHATQTPADLAALLALAVCSAGIARRVVVEPRAGWREPVNLFTAILLDPGNRKSAVFADALRPLKDLEAALIDAVQPDVARALSRRRMREREGKKLEEKAVAKGDRHAAQQAEAIAAELAEQPEPVLPRLIVDDATAEKLGMILAEQGGRIASMSPEGGVFDLMAGLYSKNGIPQFGVYLMGHSGDDLMTDRVSRKSIRVKQPALTCAYAMQPAVVKGLAREPAFRGRGLLARFLYAAPTSWIGRRQVAATPVSEATQMAYREVVRRLAEGQDGFVLRLTPEAGAFFANWELDIEVMLRDGERMEVMRDWGAKLAGETLRLAAVLHCAQEGAAENIDAKTMTAAVEIARYLIPHAEAVLNMMAACKATADDDAQYVLRWIERHGKTAFTKSEAQHHGKRRFRQATSIHPALAELARRGIVRLRPTEVSGPGRPPSPAYEVNPLVFAKRMAENRSRNSRNSLDDAAALSSGNTRSASSELPDEARAEPCESRTPVVGTNENGGPPAGDLRRGLLDDDDGMPSAYRHGF